MKTRQSRILRTPWSAVIFIIAASTMVGCGSEQGALPSNAPDSDGGTSAGPSDASADGGIVDPDAGEVVECLSAADCDSADDTACRANECAPATSTCEMVSVNEAGACDDGNACTANGACQGGECIHAESCCEDGLDNDGDGLVDCDDLNCSSDPACEVVACAAVPLPDEPLAAPLPGEATTGISETVLVDGFTDDYVYNGSQALKVGVRREWGGRSFFGTDNGVPGPNLTNVIDANDTGRAVQVAFYNPDRRIQGCAWNASCQAEPSSCPLSITFLGWNPVQGGNRCNNGSPTQSTSIVGGILRHVTEPLFWNPNWDRTDCSSAACDVPELSSRPSDVRVSQSLRFVREHVVELEYTLENLSSLDHSITAQEFPTVYTGNGNQGPDVWRLFDSTGTEITIDIPANDGFFRKPFSSPGGWVSMQNEALDYGVGLYTENRLGQWEGWQNRSLPFNNFRPTFDFAIPALGVVRARSYLILGGNATVASEAAWLDTHLPPFGSLDSPTMDQAVSSSLAVQGWALDNKGVASVEAIIDGTTAIPLSYGDSRPDVCAVWPKYAGCGPIGYSGVIDTSSLSECAHLLEIRAVDTDGNSRIIARRRVTVTH